MSRLIFVIVLLWSTSVSAGAPAPCAADFSLARFLDNQRRVVIEVEAIKTVRKEHDVKIHRVKVLNVLWGTTGLGETVIVDCEHWKCSSLSLKKGERMILIASRGSGEGGKPLSLPGRVCRGFRGSVFSVDRTQPRTQRLMQAIAWLRLRDSFRTP